MNRFTRSIVFVIITFLSCNFSFAGGGSNSNESLDWELINESFGIKVYERWIKNESDVKVRERSGKMIIQSTLEEVINLISDVSKVHLWMNNVEKAELLKSVSETEWYQRTVLDAPWPFSKQDMVSKYIISRFPEKDKAQVLILKESRLFPKQDGIDRLDSFNACWDIEKISEDKVKVTFTTTSTKPPEYPCWMQDPIVRNMFFSNLKNFKSLISEV